MSLVGLTRVSLDSLIEDSMKARIDEWHDALRDVTFYDSSIGAYARSTTEPWLKTSDYGSINQNVHVHLYRFPGKDEDEMMHLARKADEILKYKQDGREMPAGLWNTYKGFVVQVTKQDKSKVWIRNDQAIRNTLKYSGTFVLRRNVESDPIAALKTYRMRGTVENDFEQFKNWLDGDRMRCTEKTYLGKLFVCTMATSLRLMMMHQANVNEKTLNMKVPNNSMDVLFGKLRLIKAEKRKDANAWVVRRLAKKAARIIRAAWIRVASESSQITDMDQLSGSFGVLAKEPPKEPLARKSKSGEMKNAGDAPGVSTDCDL